VIEIVFIQTIPLVTVKPLLVGIITTEEAAYEDQEARLATHSYDLMEATLAKLPRATTALTFTAETTMIDMFENQIDTAIVIETVKEKESVRGKENWEKGRSASERLEIGSSENANSENERSVNEKTGQERKQQRKTRGDTPGTMGNL
jgi:hypothetical protein